MSTITKFWDAANRPPRGGWSFTIGGMHVTKFSESDILDEMEKWHRNNGTGKTRQEMEAELWDHYCRMQPERCGMSATQVQRTVAENAVSADKTPAVQGPPTWGWLNTIAVQWTPSLHSYFLETCDIISIIFECPDCRAEWRRLLQQYPPAGLNSRSAVCRWLNDQHNRVNRKLGKREYPYERMVSEWGAPLV